MLRLYCCRREDKLDWMYQGGVGARQEANQRHEAQEQQQQDRAQEPGVGRETLPSFYQEDTPASANEMWQRLHTDPLFVMKQQELMARRSIVSNPVKMDAIKNRVKQIEEEKTRKRKDKHDRSRRRRSRSRHRHTGADDEGHRHHISMDGDERRKHRHHEDKRRGHSEDKRRGHSEDKRRGHSEDKRRGHSEDKRRGHSDDEDRRHDARRKREHDRHRNRYNEDNSDRSHRSGHSIRQEYFDDDRKRTRLDCGEHRRSSPSPDLSPIPRHNYSNRHQIDHSHSHHHNIVHDGASFQDNNQSNYGITYGSHIPVAVKNKDRSDIAEATRRRLEEAAKKKEQEEREKAAQRHIRRDHKTGRLSKEERERRLRDMTQAAAQHDSMREKRIKQYQRKVEEEETGHMKRAHGSVDTFLRHQTQNALG